MMNIKETLNKWGPILDINKYSHPEQIKITQYAEQVVNYKSNIGSFTGDVDLDAQRFIIGVNVLKKLPINKVTIVNYSTVNVNTISFDFIIKDYLELGMVVSNEFIISAIQDELIQQLRVIINNNDNVEIGEICSKIDTKPIGFDIKINITSRINTTKINKKDTKLKVFISSPYTIGDKEINVQNSLAIADTLMDMGTTPFAPLLTHYQGLSFARKEQDWIDWDIEWLLLCDIVLRLPGKSVGADAEVKIALENDILVLYSLEDLQKHMDLTKFNNTQTN